jgi:hypothetical protein
MLKVELFFFLLFFGTTAAVNADLWTKVAVASFLKQIGVFSIHSGVEVAASDTLMDECELSDSVRTDLLLDVRRVAADGCDRPNRHRLGRHDDAPLRLRRADHNCDSPEIGAIWEHTLLDHAKQSSRRVEAVRGTAPFDFYLPCQHGATQDVVFHILAGKIANSAAGCTGVGVPRLFLLRSPERLSSKLMLWREVSRALGISRASQIIPRSYDLSLGADLSDLRSSHSSRDVYFLKTEEHRQKGLVCVGSPDAVLASAQSGRPFVLAQRLLRKPYTLDSFKVNFRLYLLLVCHTRPLSAAPVMQAYLSRTGFVYYSAVPWVDLSGQEQVLSGAVDCTSQVTTGYVPRDHYKDRPLSFVELVAHWNAQGRNSSAFIQLLHSNLVDVVRALNQGKSMCQRDQLHFCFRRAISFQHFGCDFEPSHDLTAVHLFECNRG